MEKQDILVLRVNFDQLLENQLQCTAEFVSKL